HYSKIVTPFNCIHLLCKGGHASCPIELSPPSVVVRYGDPVSINCSTSETLFEGIGWEATEGAKPLQNVSHLTWTVDKLTDWSFSTSCYFNYHENSSSTQCLITPDVVLYSKFTFPEAITMSSNSDEGVMKEMEEYNFTCHIPNIAPVQRLSVKWYKGDDFLHTETFNNNNKKPVNQTSILRFKATRQDSGVTFRCEAHMDLGQGELQLIVLLHKTSTFRRWLAPCSEGEAKKKKSLEGAQCNRKGPAAVGKSSETLFKWMK
uniref:Ig-like domain-containing protein n=1 Tax=Labrus bergylta TaxID=56723 RepID=A0A3Q3G3M0_9LABR